MTNKLLSHVALKSSGPKLYWPNVILAGARNERFYRLFDRDLDVDRTLPLSAREWATYRSFRSDNQLPSSACPQFLLEILGLRSRPSIYDLLIHPCAGAKNRLWSVEKYQALLVALPASWRIAFLALPEEISNLGNVLSSDRQVNFIPIQVSLRSSLEALFSAQPASAALTQIQNC